MTTKIYYVMDTMCGWCYGFSDVISQIYDKYKQDLDFTVVPAGMWIGENVQIMNPRLGNFIKTHNVTISELTGKQFGEDFEKNILQHDNFKLDSLPGATAVTIIQSQNREKTFAYLKQIYNSFYVQGKDTNDWQLYADLAAAFGIEKETFKKEYFSDAQLQNVQHGFSLANTLGVSTYPSVVAVEDGKIQLLSQGYIKFDELDKIIANL